MKLTSSQREVLLVCADGEWHASAKMTQCGQVSGVSAKSLYNVGLLEGRGGLPARYRITDQGRRTLEKSK